MAFFDYCGNRMKVCSWGVISPTAWKIQFVLQNCQVTVS